MAAEPVQIQGSSYVGKIRTPIITVLLTVVTFGIYGLVWYFKVNKEMAEIGQAKGTTECGTNPTTSVLALIPGGFIVIPALVSYWNSTKRLAKTREVTGTPPGMDPPLLFLLLILIGPVGIYLFQDNLNKALQAQAGGVPAPITAAATPEAPVSPPSESPAAPPTDPPAQA
jgi:hypothetical protein